ncbi:hypothetical protein C8R43DRAFT_933928, partial [Mycena crocata]
MNATSDFRFPRSGIFPDSNSFSQLKDILRSNAPVPAHIPSTIAALSDELKRYDTEMARIQAQLDAVEADRTVVQEYQDACHSLFSPIRRIPSEIWAEIFSLWRVDQPSLLRAQLADPMHDLAHAPLLAMAQVCSRWHSIVMNTPTLWTTINLRPGLWTTTDESEKSMAVLRDVLERSGNSPLKIDVFNRTYPSAVTLVAQHSERWKEAKFVGTLARLRAWSEVKGRLTSLQTLELNIWGTLDFFEGAPMLRHLIVRHSVRGLSDAVLQHLRTLGCVALKPSELSTAVPLMSRLPRTCRYRIEVDLRRPLSQTPADIPTLPETPTSSNVDGFTVEILGYFDLPERRPMLALILTNLILPNLGELIFESPYDPLPWPHPEFIALSDRSSFNAHLHSLDLRHVFITQTELFECLAGLSSLERLGIADHVNRGRDAENLHLITNSLLQRLTRTHDSTSSDVVPRLRVFTIESMLEFSDIIYLNFLTSRTQTGRIFEHTLHWLYIHRRELDPYVTARIYELRRRSELVFLIARANRYDNIQPWSL